MLQVVDVSRAELVHRFTPCRELHDQELPPSEPPITKMFTSSDGQWLAAINCFGDIYVFNLEIQRYETILQSFFPWQPVINYTFFLVIYKYFTETWGQFSVLTLFLFLYNRQHWFISRLDSASVTAGGFSPQNNNVLVITTSSNQVYALDVEERTLGDWSKQHTNVLPKRFQEFPGEVIGMSFPPSTSSSSVIVYSSRCAPFSFLVWMRCDLCGFILKSLEPWKLLI